MSEFDAVRVRKTLKFGETVYQGGKVYYKPFSPDILKEVARGSPHLEVMPAAVEEPQEAQTESPTEVEKPEKSSRLVRRSK
jgi:hypothetical protein